MGGQNHQPCRQYLPISTQLSRFISLSRSDLELANIALEDLILVEIGSKPESGVDFYDEINRRLSSSGSNLLQALSSVQEIDKRMDELDFVDLPTLKTIDIDQLGIRFVGSAIVNIVAWQKIAELMKSGGFRLVLEDFANSIQLLYNLTQNLLKKMEGLRTAAEQLRISDIIEENLPGNFKNIFAQLYTKWAEFNQSFLASSMLSTELWYAANGYSSILPVKIEEIAV